jgi:hypothetical protein
MAHHHRGRVVEGQADQSPVMRTAFQRVPADEVALSHPDGEAQPGLVRIVLVVMSAPQAR